jgi:chromate transporter
MLGENPVLLLVIAYAVRRLPYVVRSASAGFQQVSPSLEEAAQNLGARPEKALWRITLPLVAPNLVAGGLLAGLLFVGPGAALILALAAFYVSFGAQPLVQAAFVGVQAAVVIIVVQALQKVAKRALKDRAAYVIAALAFLGIFVLGVPFPLIIAAAGLYGLLTSPGATGASEPLPAHRDTARTVAIWAGLWVLPLLALPATGQMFLWDVALFFSQLAVVTFGGAYAVLAWMAQAVVDTKGWITTQQMIDALGLAETTPGPLILVTEFVAFLAGHGRGGMALGVAAAGVALWAPFLPCFLWIFAGAPYVDWIMARPRLKGALAAITAAVVGVILNLALWFALHVLFGQIATTGLGALPVWATLDMAALGLTALAGLLLLRLHLDLLVTLALMAAAGIALHLVL